MLNRLGALSALLLLCWGAPMASAATPDVSVCSTWVKIASAGTTIDVQTKSAVGVLIATSNGSPASGTGGPVLIGGDSHRNVSPLTDLWAISNSSTACALVGILDGLSSGAGGKVGIDQTTPGTTNGVVVNSSALPTGAAQESGNLATIMARTPPLGQTTKSASTPVTLPSDQGAIPVIPFVGSPTDTAATQQSLTGLTPQEVRSAEPASLGEWFGQNQSASTLIVVLCNDTGSTTPCVSRAATILLGPGGAALQGGSAGWQDTGPWKGRIDIYANAATAQHALSRQ